MAGYSEGILSMVIGFCLVSQLNRPCDLVSEPDPQKDRKGGSGISVGVEVYTAPGMQAHFRLGFD